MMRRQFPEKSQTDDNRKSLIESYFNTFIWQSNSNASASSSIESTNNIDSNCNSDEFYRHEAIANVQAACELLECIDWKMEKIVSSTGDCIQSIYREDFGKIYRLTAQMDLPAKVLLNIMYENEAMPTWNPTVLEAKILKKIDNHTDITYSVSAPGAGGFVDSRDFVDLRCWQTIKNGNIIHEAGTVDNEKEITENSSNFLEQTVQQLSSINESQLTENQLQGSSFNQSFSTLSMCLGANVFFDDEFDLLASELCSRRGSSDSETFVDARECQDAQSTIEVEQIKDSCDTIYVVSSVSIEYDQMPPIAKYTRGKNLMTFWSMRESKTDPNICTFEWIMCLDLRAVVPRFVLDRAFIGVMEDFMKHLRNRCHSNKALQS